MRKIREKSHRLPQIQYRGETVVAFTVCLKERPRFFVSKATVRPIEQILLNELRRFRCEAEVYMFMPDHCHFLLRGTSVSSDAYSAIRMFKQRSGYWLHNNYPKIHWQKDFYDHIVRDLNGISKHIDYILHNPVRAEMESDWKLYPYKGSTIHNLDEWD